LSGSTYDQLRTLYRTLLVYATVGVLILSIGIVQFYEYDPTSHKTVGPDRSEFPRSEEFAAVVDWSSLPSNLIVDARWYDTFGSMRGAVGPAHPSALTDHGVVPVEAPEGFHLVLPGRYTFVVERLQDGVPVEVLGRRFVVVDRS